MLVPLAQFLFLLFQLVLWGAGLVGVLVLIPLPSILFNATTTGASLEQDLKLATETPSDPPIVLAVPVKPRANLVLLIALLKIACKVLGSQLLSVLFAGTEQLIPSTPLFQFSRVLSRLSPCLEVLIAIALGLWAVENVNSLSTATSLYVQLIVL